MKINEINSNDLHQINKDLSSKRRCKNRQFSLSLHVNGQTEQITIKIIDNKSKETMKETSTQELRDIHGQIYDMAGRLFNEEA